MCLGLICTVSTVLGDDLAIVRAGEREMRVCLLTVDEPVRPGDRLLVHAGFALARLTDREAADAAVVRTGETEGLS